MMTKQIESRFNKSGENLKVVNAPMQFKTINPLPNVKSEI